MFFTFDPPTHPQGLATFRSIDASADPRVLQIPVTPALRALYDEWRRLLHPAAFRAFEEAAWIQLHPDAQRCLTCGVVYRPGPAPLRERPHWDPYRDVAPTTPPACYCHLCV